MPSSAKRRSLDRRWRFGLVGLAAALDAAIVGPLVGRGSVHLLDLGDYPQAEHAVFAPSAYGFPPGITSRAPVEAVLYWILHIPHASALALLPFLVVAPLGCAGFARMFPSQGAAIALATVLFTVNPFIYERMANGQVYVVLGYSLLPVLAALVARPLNSAACTVLLGGLIFAVDIAVSVHFLFITGTLLIVMIAGSLAAGERRAALAACGTVLSGLVLSSYWLIPAAQAATSRPLPVTKLDLTVFQTVPDPVFGLLANVTGLYGFWRPGVPLAKSQLSGWPFLLLAILIVAGIGARDIWVRGGRQGRALTLCCALLAVVSIVLAVGAQGPTGAIYTWLFNNIPGFKVMREPDKFAALLAFAYATCFGPGAAALARSLGRPAWRAACLCCLAALSLAYGYTELDGFDGSARPVAYPASWAAADRVMTPGAEALALPWQAYLQVPWTGDRVISNPLPGFFNRSVISGDDLEAGPITTESTNPRSLFLQFCLTQATHISVFGRLLAPLGIRYVVVAKVQVAGNLTWLSRQRDLTQVFNSSTIAVYRNDEPAPGAYAPLRRIVVDDWGQVVALAQRYSLDDFLIRVRHARPGPFTLPLVPGAHPPPPRSVSVTRTTPVSSAIKLPEGIRDVVIAAPAFPGWRLPDFRTSSQFGVTAAFTRRGSLSAKANVTAVYGPWRFVRACDVAGGLLLAADVASLLVLAARQRRRSRRGWVGTEITTTGADEPTTAMGSSTLSAPRCYAYGDC